METSILTQGFQNESHQDPNQRKGEVRLKKGGTKLSFRETKLVGNLQNLQVLAWGTNFQLLKTL